MGKRIKIGIVYSYDENWIGGTYYYQYLIQSLNLLPINEKPHLVILSKDNKCFKSIEKFNYPFISYRLLKNKSRLLSKLKKFIGVNDPQIKRKINFGIDVLFHPSAVDIPNTIKNHLYWIPDFQEYYLPELFSETYLNFRKKTQARLLDDNKHILFSSIDAQNDFKKIYPNAKSNTYVVNFAVFHSDYSEVSFNDLMVKFNFENKKYFFSPNQFWTHKNHMVILKSIVKLKKICDYEPLILFTGKEYDYRNPKHFENLKKYVDDNDLSKNVKFLGFIDRLEQLCLMNNALAVIQPSLFEGWSSVVEDAKAMNQNLIVSDLNVHKEQLGNNGYFFDPNDEIQLKNHLLLFLENKIKRPEYDYNNYQKLFGVKFMEVVKTII